MHTDTMIDYFTADINGKIIYMFNSYLWLAERTNCVISLRIPCLLKMSVSQ